MTSRIDEMRKQIRETPMAARAHPVSPRRRVRLWGGGLVGLALAIAASVAVLAIGGGSTPAPAYAAVSRLHHGQRTVTITLREEQDIPKLNARLQAEHTRIRVVPIIRGCDDPVHQVLPNGHLAPGPAKTVLAIPQYLAGKQVFISQETILVNTKRGRTFVVPDSRTGFLNGGGGVVMGPAPKCAGVGPRLNLPKGYPSH